MPQHPRDALRRADAPDGLPALALRHGFRCPERNFTGKEYQTHPSTNSREVNERATP